MNKYIKSLFIIAAIIAPARQVSALEVAQCDQIVRMAFGSIISLGLYKVFEHELCNLWDYGVDRDQLYKIETIGTEQSGKKSILQGVLKLAKNIGKTSAVLLLGYAFMYNSLSNLFLSANYDIIQANLQAQCFGINAYQRESWLIDSNGVKTVIPHDKNLIRPSLDLVVNVS